MPSTSTSPTEATRYPYHDADGTLLYWNVRFVPKTFRPEMPDGSRTLTSRRVLYRLPALEGRKRTERVWYVEGEKDADRLASHGLLATTAGSTSAAGKTDHTPLLMALGMVIVPDCDDTGRKMAEALATEFYKKGKHQVQVLDLGGSNGYDVSDYLDTHDVSELKRLRFNTPTWKWKPKPKRSRRTYTGGGGVGLPWPIEDVVYALGGSMFGGHGQAYCPAHDDEGSANLGLSLDPVSDNDDRTLVFCHSGCEFNQIAAAIRKEMT